MKYLLALGFLGMANAHFVTIDGSDGFDTCEDAGYLSLNKTQCENDYKAYVDGSVPDVNYGSTSHPSKCSIRTSNSYIYWNSQVPDPATWGCSSTYFASEGSNAYYDCVCWDPTPPDAGGAGSEAGGGGGDCCAGCTPAQYIDAQCCQC